MKKIDLLKFAFASMLLVQGTTAIAQPKMYNFNGNYYNDYVGARVIISAPTAIEGQLVYTISNDGVGTGDWGGQIPSTPMLNVPVVKTNPYDACGTLTNAGAVSGKIALIMRGTCEFGAKALTAQQAGAVAVIIVNNVPGGAVGMGVGAQGGSVTIPVIMISDLDGAKIDAQLSASVPVTISLSRWGNNKTHDLGIVNSGTTLWHSNTIPLSQMSGTVPAAYKRIDGAVVANFGTSAETGIKLKTTVTWTPTGGSATVVKEDSVNYPGTFNPGDSIIAPFIDNIYSLAQPTTTGKYDVTTTVTAANADDFPKDNTQTTTYYVTNNVFSKGVYDVTNGKPFSNISYAYASSSDFLWGPLYYIANGGYEILSLKFAMSVSGGGSLSGQQPVNILVWKWKDGTNSQPLDNVIQSGEVTIVGSASKTGFAIEDSSGDFFDVPVTNPDNANVKMVTEDNTYYWVTASMASGTFLACDGASNYYVRSWAMAKATTPQKDHYAPIFNGTYGAFGTGSTNVAFMFPFESKDDVDTARFSNQRKGIMPAIPIVLNTFKTGVSNVNPKAPISVEIFPNPATDLVNVSIALDAKANKVYYTIIDASGKRLVEEMHANVKTDKLTVSTSKLAAGNYFVIINADDKTTVKKFSVVK